VSESVRRWVVISGANGALGSALTAHYLAKASPVIAVDRVLARLPQDSSTGQLVALQADITSETEIASGLDAAMRPGDEIALLINAVGAIWSEPVIALRRGALATHDMAHWRNVIDANLTAAFVMATMVIARMARRGGGSIVNFSSIASTGNPGQCAYAAAKAGIEGLTRAMAAEVGPFGIRVNAVAPGFIDVETTRAAVPDAKLRGYAERSPLRRLGQIADIIEAIEFLEASAFVTGAIVPVDGGLRL
jgi:3-oxoacyl-[acyl-carrier protein] reductase